MRIASITVALPSALSVAPVPVCHESRCAPTITISSFTALSVPGISADHVVRVAIRFVVGRLNLHRELHRNLLLEHLRHQVVVLGGEDDRRHRVGAHVAAGHEHRAVLADIRLDGHAHAFASSSIARRSALSCGGARRRRRRRFQIAAGRRAIGANGVLLDRAREHDGALELAGVALSSRRLQGRESRPAWRRCGRRSTATSRAGSR